MTMRVLLVLVVIGFSATAFAQSAPPKVGNRPLAQVKPKEPIGCKLVGTVKGTKLWAGDCTSLDGLIPAPEQHESAYLLPENAVDGGVVFGI
jgi:hypothetical protein